MRLMREHRLGCLPVTEDRKLVGLVTESDLINVSVGLLEDYLREE
jgi:CBS domain-containing protein